MTMRLITPKIALLLAAIVPVAVLAQSDTVSVPCDPIADRCEQYITAAYIPDGQFYRALLQGDEIADFGLTLFGGNTYRVAACSGMTDRNLIFTVYDQQRNVLYTNKEFSNEPYWDLSVANTVEVTIEAQVDPSKAGSGCAVLLIGFKR